MGYRNVERGNAPLEKSPRLLLIDSAEIHSPPK